jgi:cytochrome oxidase Cu insertion factor (SCO1/SenC/PrrC family)
MNKLMKTMFILGLLGLVAALAAFVYSATLRGNANPGAMATSGASAGPAQPTLVIPPFTLIDHTGATRTRGDVLEGHVTITDFFFTNCPLACPAMTSALMELQKKLKGTGVRFASFSIDTANDTPAVLTDYISNRFQIDTSNWTFLTENPNPDGSFTNAARKIFATDLMQFVEDRPEEQIKTTTGGTMANIYHGVNFFLVGPDGTVLGWYNSQRPEELARLQEHAVGAAKRFLSRPTP